MSKLDGRRVAGPYAHADAISYAPVDASLLYSALCIIIMLIAKQGSAAADAKFLELLRPSQAGSGGYEQDSRIAE